MGNCYFKKCSIIFNQSEIEVYDKNEKKEEDSKKEVIIKTDFENLNNNNLNKLQNNNSNRNNIVDNKKEEKEKYKYTKENEQYKDTKDTKENEQYKETKEKEKYKETKETIEKENEKMKEAEEIKRRLVKQKIMKTIKSTTAIIKLKNKLGFKIKKSNNDNLLSDNDESINKDKESSLLHFDDSENDVSQKNEKKKKKFQRRNAKCVTRVDKSFLNQQLIDYEMSIPIFTEALIIQQTGNLRENYEIKKKIGNGPDGVVYRAKNIYLKNIVAIKIIKKAKENKEDDLNVENHINIIKQLTHPNIVKLYQFYSSKNYYQLITEYFKK